LEPLSLALVDHDDEWVIASAVLIESELFVTGDQGVLACQTAPLPLLSPRDCWERLRQPD
jgi:hypothetical protein